MSRTLLAVLLSTCAFAAGVRERKTVVLDGTWQIEESVEPDRVPSAWTHSVPVPGLANLAQPKFADVDEFDSMEVINNRIRKGDLPESARLTDKPGIPRQKRNYFWYRRTFTSPEKREVAILKINKAQFGTKAWLNGKEVGEHLPCFSAGYFNVTSAMNWTGENVLLVRVGAHPAVLPLDFPAGTDFEKNRWTPGIYDSVSLQLSDAVVVESVQVAPRVSPPSVTVETTLRNYGSREATVALAHHLPGFAAKAEAAIRIAPGAEATRRVTIDMPGAKLWTPESPNLYTLTTRVNGDHVNTRFGVREFRFDTATKRAYLNGKPYFLRGSNVTLHRWLEDPLAGDLTWNEKWVRRLLGEIPKRMNWNAFRFCIGPVPDKWLEIADEVGLLIQNEFFIWTGDKWGGYHREWNADELARQYREWMRDNWNHPSVAVWDANNESFDPVFAKVIPQVRGLDLSNRPWENSYNLPVGPEDPVEDHPYLFQRNEGDGKQFAMTELESMFGTGHVGRSPSAHAQVLNEYGWLWLLRDGTPTELTRKVYAKLLGPNATGKQRLELNGYLLGGLTEFWRAHRNYAGVLHFVYLTSCYPGAYTCDHFADPRTLELDPTFADYVREAFKPVGVYLNFWQPTLKAGSERRYVVMVVNDKDQPVSGTLTLAFEDGSGRRAGGAEQRLEIPALGAHTYEFTLATPSAGRYLLKATATTTGEPTVSRRKVEVQ